MLDINFNIQPLNLIKRRAMRKKLRVCPWSVSKTDRDFLTMRNGSFEEYLKVTDKWVNKCKQMVSYKNKK